MSATRPALSPSELGRFLEIQNLGLNLPFAIAFLLLAARGLPDWWPTFLLVVAFVAARNAGHAFNRWTDRDLDAQNPRTQGRALVTGRISPAATLGLVAAMALVVVVCALLLNLLALALAPVALALVLGYSLSKRRTAWTTVMLGLVESITPAAVFIGLRGTLPLDVLLAVGAILLWGTAFETIHSLGDLETDRRLGLPTLPGVLGARASVRLVPVLHAAALGLLALFGWSEGLHFGYYLALLAMAALAGFTDRALALNPDRATRPFRYHFLLGGLYLLGAILGLL